MALSPNRLVGWYTTIGTGGGIATNDITIAIEYRIH